MRVSLGTIDVEDDVRKAIRKLNGGKGDATRNEIKDYLLGLIDDHGKLLVSGGVEARSAAPDQVQTEWSHPDAGAPTLPEPTAAGDSTPSAPVGGTTPSAEGSTPTSGTGATPGF